MGNIPLGDVLHAYGSGSAGAPAARIELGHMRTSEN